MAVLAPRLSPHPTADTEGGAPGWARPWEQSSSQPASAEAAPERVQALHSRQKPSGVERTPFSMRQACSRHAPWPTCPCTREEALACSRTGGAGGQSLMEWFLLYYPLEHRT